MTWSAGVLGSDQCAAVTTSAGHWALAAPGALPVRELEGICAVFAVSMNWTLSLQPETISIPTMLVID